MIVLIAGMPRSGSTFSFNVARDVLGARGTVYQEATADIAGAINRSKGARYVLLKSHALDAPSMGMARTGAIPIIITIRRVEDAIASWITTFETHPEDMAIETMRNWLRMYRALRSRALTVHYNQIDRHPWLAAWRIARTVCPEIRPTEVIQIARRFKKAAIKRQADAMDPSADKVQDIGFSYFDTETFFHRRHVSQLRSLRAEERLLPRHVARLRASLAPDIGAAGL